MVNFYLVLINFDVFVKQQYAFYDFALVDPTPPNVCLDLPLPGPCSASSLSRLCSISLVVDSAEGAAWVGRIFSPISIGAWVRNRVATLVTALELWSLQGRMCLCTTEILNISSINQVNAA